MARKEPDELHPETAELREIRKSLRLKQQEFAEAIGVPWTTYQPNEYRRPAPTVMERARSYKARATGSVYRATESQPSGLLKVWSTAGAGDAPYSTMDASLLPVPIEFANPSYSGVVLDDAATSMMPYLQPGDTLVFKDSKTIRVNKIVAMRPPNHVSPIVKKAVFSGELIVLRSFNSVYSDIEPINYEPLGVLVGFISADGLVKVGPVDSGIDEKYIEAQLRSRLPN